MRLKEAIDASLEHLRPWMLWAEHEPQSLQDKIESLRRARAQFDLGNDFIYAIFNKTESQVLGGSGLHTRAGPMAREIGYWVHRDFINQGIATETASALTKVAFEIDGVHRVEIHCDPLNVRSAAVPQKLGYQLEARLSERIQKPDGTWRDTLVWTIFARDYPNSPSASSKLTAFDVIGRRIL
jgi:RimJ/RimL family protein N-acetyltransferase